MAKAVALSAADLSPTKPQSQSAGRQRGAQFGIEPLRGDAVIGGGQGPLVSGEGHVVALPALDDEPLEQPAIGVRDIAAEERPDVIAAKLVVLFDQQQVEVGLALGQRQRDQATGKSAAQDHEIVPLNSGRGERRHEARCSERASQRNHRLALAPERAIVGGDG